MARLEGKIILVTGGASGMGAADSRALVAEGARVVIADLQDDRGMALATELGDAATFVHHDVTSEADWNRSVRVAEAIGGLHGLVNNAGVYEYKSMMETGIALWERTIRINQTGCFLGLKAAVPLLERSGGGSIVNMSSIAGLRASPAFAYAATKWALRGMTKSAAIELAALKIRVNSVHPGPIATEMMGGRAAEDIQALTAKVPLQRQGTAEEVARLVLFLLSDDSSFITGAEIAIDGGMTS